MSLYTDWVEHARRFAREDIRQRMPAGHYFHNIDHVEQVVSALHQLAGAAGLEERESTILQLAGWFHDLGYADGAAGHEERGAALARQVLGPLGVSEEMLDQIEACILATRMPQQPKSRLQALMADADLSHLGTAEYWSFIGKLRQELKEVQGREMDDPAWLRFEIGFLEQHEYHTAEARVLFGKRKKKHIRKLKEMLSEAEDGPGQGGNPAGGVAADVPAASGLPSTGKKKKDDRPGESPAPEEAPDPFHLAGQKFGRGVETMFRSAYRTHINLSSIADNKANIMLSINAIIISITVSTLVPRFGENPRLILPTILLLAVCLTAIIFATLSTMPKVTKGTVTRESIEKREANLIFFGNFFRMRLPDYQWGMHRLITDKRYIYDTMTRDIYFLGIVLARKYAMLRYCYLVFMWGLIAVVLAFALSFVGGEPR